MTLSATDPLTSAAVVRPLQAADLDEADRIMRIAFGTYLKAPDPVDVFGDVDLVHTRFHAAPATAFCAELDGSVVASNFATRWGSFAFFGPLTVRVDLWDRGIAGQLMQPILDLFEQWGVRQAGLFTFPESVKHVALYTKYGFWPQQLTPVLVKPVAPASTAAGYTTFTDRRRTGADTEVLRDCRDLTGAIYDGLDLEDEVRAVDRHGLGETVLVGDDTGLAGFAVCHVGAGTEAGSGACYIKFGAARPGMGAPERFQQLLSACEAFAADRQASRIIAGVNTARHDAYRRLLDRGYRPMMNGVAMMRPNDPGYNRPDAHVIDDLR